MEKTRECIDVYKRQVVVSVAVVWHVVVAVSGETQKLCSLIEAVATAGI